jgi:hypothetical protein
MKKLKKPLALRGETIRDLASHELQTAAGGVTGQVCTASNFCTHLCTLPTTTSTCPV